MAVGCEAYTINGTKVTANWSAKGYRLPTEAEWEYAAKGGGAFVLKLAPMAQAKFAMPPERAPKNPDSFGGLVTIGLTASAGLLQVTLSEEAWIDVIQNEARVKSAAFSGKQGCAGMRKSVRFELAAVPFTIQISGAAADQVKVAVAPVQ